jgi:single-stranded-DNA-specific exonuclease
MRAAVARILGALDSHERIVLFGDYDVDGVTSLALLAEMLRGYGATPELFLPLRMEEGYGLSRESVERCLEQYRPQLLIAIDCGTASAGEIAELKNRGVDVIVLDHHEPKSQLPDCVAIVNPKADSASPFHYLCSVGIVFKLCHALLKTRPLPEFDLKSKLDLVALGTVADVVKLDSNNRRLVAQGLKRIRAGRMQPGIAALFHVAARRHERASAFDFGFALGPRLNAAGRLADMTLGIECLLTDDPTRAAELAAELDRINRERRDVEAGMREQAEALMEQIMPTGAPPAALALFHEGFHEGVVGIVAGRMKDRLHRPTFVFAVGADGYLKGSGRSIPGFHLRDALDLVTKRHPGVLRKFGGHSMAAGCTIAREDFETFDQAFSAVAQEWLSPAALSRVLATDGPLALEWFNVATVAALDAQVWGQGFEAPTFCDEVDVVQQRLVGEKHLKLRVRHAGTLRDAIWFGHSEPVPERVRLAYRLSIDEFQGQQRLQMVVEAAG